MKPIRDTRISRLIRVLSVSVFFLACVTHLPAADITATLDSSDGTSGFSFRDSSSAEQARIDSDGNMVLKGGLRLDADGAVKSSPEVLIVDGKIGIGTDNPLYEQHTYGSSAWGLSTIAYPTTPSGAALVGLGSTSNYRIAIQDGTARVNHYWNAYYDTAAAVHKYVVAAEPASRQIFSTDGFYFMTAPASVSAGDSITWVNAMKIDINGQVGIGTISPGASLEVIGTSKGIVPFYSVTVCDTANYNDPSQFVGPLFTWNLPSYGSITYTDNTGYAWRTSNSVLWAMNVHSKGAQSKTLNLFAIDDNVYVWLRGAQVFSRVSPFSSANAPQSCTLNLTDGNNLIQVVSNDAGGGGSYLSLMGDIVDNINTYFVSP
ncbi:MAG: hypothetical protein PHQ23_03595 [Candidatus Wallbacteria bacterium]|nr:hypothetical protein [Candidatus Wallbacteria bacterium]